MVLICLKVHSSICIERLRKAKGLCKSDLNLKPCMSEAAVLTTQLWQRFLSFVIQHYVVCGQVPLFQRNLLSSSSVQKTECRKIWAVCCSKIVVPIHRITIWHITEYSNCHSLNCENLEFRSAVMFGRNLVEWVFGMDWPQ